MNKTTNKSTFWLVWTPTGIEAEVKYSTEQAARNEAERLSVRNIGESFFVLKNTGHVVSRIVEPLWTSTE